MGVIRPADIHKTLTVKAPAARAFAVFTDGMHRWWPATHSVGATPLKRAVLEPWVGGRWYGLSEAGVEDVWGEVLAWEPPVRLLLTWAINARFQCDATVRTELEIRFTDLGDGSTRVDLVHRHLDRLGEGALQTVERMHVGWGVILGHFKAAAEA